MKKHLLFALLCLMGITSVQKAYAAKEIFAILYNNQMQIAYDEKANYSGVIENWSPENGTRNMLESEREQITSVMITNTMSQARPTSMYCWFAELKNATYITGLEYLHTENVTDMNSTFYGCSSLTSLNVAGFNTSNVTNMRTMFYNCSSLTSLDVTNFNTANVTRMSYMFYGCSSLTSLDVTNFNTSNVTTMRSMFYKCSSLTSLDVTKFNTANVTDMAFMFQTCSSLTSLDVTKFNTANVTDMEDMFFQCSLLTSLDVTKFNTANVTNMNSMFCECSKLTSLDVTKFNTANVTDMSYMFNRCSSLKSLDLTSFNVEKVDSMKYMFYNDSELKTIYCNEDWSKHNVIKSSGMFINCTALIGDKGTRYDSDYTDITYARPDLNSKPGYFTRKSIQGIEEIPSNSPSRGEKILRDGQLFILRDGKTYDARGVEIKK